MDNSAKLRHLSLCSGYGGIGIGIKRIFPNLRDIAHVEIEAYACANLVAKMETDKMDATPIWTDLKTFSFSEFYGVVDILTGGFPCQPFSSAGQQKSTEDERHLFPYILKGIQEARPSIVFLENVEGIIHCKTAEGKSVLHYVLGELERVGYTATAGIFSAEEVGAPHRRKRVFILGISNTKGERLDRVKQLCRSATKFSSSPALYNHYPSRPKEPQKEWEEPRLIVVNSNRGGFSRGKPKANPRGGEDFKKGGEIRGKTQGSSGSYASNNGSENETKSSMGGTINGDPYRVDRLRLLGNGVVPDTAELAFRELIKRLI